MVNAPGAAGRACDKLGRLVMTCSAHRRNVQQWYPSGAGCQAQKVMVFNDAKGLEMVGGCRSSLFCTETMIHEYDEYL